MAEILSSDSNACHTIPSQSMIFSDAQVEFPISISHNHSNDISKTPMQTVSFSFFSYPCIVLCGKKLARGTLEVRSWAKLCPRLRSVLCAPHGAQVCVQEPIAKSCQCNLARRAMTTQYYGPDALLAPHYVDLSWAHLVQSSRSQQQQRKTSQGGRRAKHASRFVTLLFLVLHLFRKELLQT